MTSRLGLCSLLRSICCIPLGWSGGKAGRRSWQVLCMLMGCARPMVEAGAVAPMQAQLCQLLGGTLLLLVGHEGQQKLEPVGVLAVQVVPAGHSIERQAMPLLVRQQGAISNSSL